MVRLFSVYRLALVALIALVAARSVSAQVGVFIQWSSPNCTGYPQTWMFYQGTACNNWPVVTSPEQMTCSGVLDSAGINAVASVKVGCAQNIPNARWYDIQYLVTLPAGSPWAVVTDTFSGVTNCTTAIPYVVRTGYFANDICQPLLSVTAPNANSTTWRATTAPPVYIKMNCETVSQCNDSVCGSCNSYPTGQCLGENATGVVGSTISAVCVTSAYWNTTTTSSTISATAAAGFTIGTGTRTASSASGTATAAQLGSTSTAKPGRSGKSIALGTWMYIAATIFITFSQAML
ncbi:hypothetical protein M427DRAFT_60787 [Gonapodya prolifera JEL478]|uniref:Osmotin, thaumatin-like protein n=1 Tax=Gonapodya prolifera (strain JEL478) TaxID=1344416 RepID=A0A139A3T4_GONPJ|nr:hypothetical protein M427DRAFT_60787 [Gonapodya prolifera JEL478]|eukprot:KXS11374.1 hypothetical protein M427DRAFT_60787 [Gonapodya prolifera JEL478]